MPRCLPRTVDLVKSSMAGTLVTEPESLEEMGESLDRTFVKLAHEVKQRSSLLAKEHRFRIKLWLDKLYEPQTTLAWKKNRNAYARLIMEMLRKGRLEAPFDKKPEDGPLRQLQKWLTYSYEYERAPPPERQKESVRTTGKSPSHNTARRRSVSFQAPVGSRRGEEEEFIAPASRPPPDYSQASARVKKLAKRLDSRLESLGEDLGGSGVRGYIRQSATSISNNLSQESRLALETDLQETREQVNQLERSLSEANATVASQQKQINELRKKCEEKREENKRIRHEHRIELQNMIERYERRRASWSPLHAKVDTSTPIKAGTQPEGERRQPRRLDKDMEDAIDKTDGGSKDEFAAYLNNFQEQTERLRNKLGLDAV